MVRDGGIWQLDPEIHVETDPRYEVTSAWVDVTKLTNAVAGGISIVVHFGGGQTCYSHRRFTVYAADHRGGALFAGDRGYHELTCRPYLAPSQLATIGPGELKG